MAWAVGFSPNAFLLSVSHVVAIKVVMIFMLIESTLESKKQR
jgi:hypothetical protein